MIAIIGGGITALSAGIQLKKKGLEFIILESDEECGGKIQSKKIEEHLFELGPNTVLINNPETQKFIEEVGLAEELIFADKEAVKNRWVLKNKKLEPIPNSLSSAWKSKVFTFQTLRSILAEPFKKVLKDNREESLADFSRRRLGKQIYEDLITPFVSGIYAGDPEKMSILHTLSILKEAETKGGSILRGMPKILKERAKKRAAKYTGWKTPENKIFSFESGLHRMVEKASDILKEEIQFNALVNKIVKIESSYSIQYQVEGVLKELKADKIISTIPALHLSKIVDSKKLSSALDKVNYVPAIVSHFVFKKEDILQSKKSFGILSRKEEEVPFLGVLFNSYFFPHQSSPEHFILTVISGGYKQAEMINWEEESISKEVIRSLKELNQLKGDPVMSHVHKWPKAIPQYELGYSEILKEIEDFTDENSNFYIAGNFYKGISVSDCIANGAKLAAEIN